MSTTSSLPQNALDGNTKPIGITIDPCTRPVSTAGYKCYMGSLTSEAPTITLDVLSDLGEFGSRVVVFNRSSSASITFNIQFSYDGTNFGDNILATTSFAWSLDYFVLFKKIKLTLIGTIQADYTVIAI